MSYLVSKHGRTRVGRLRALLGAGALSSVFVSFAACSSADDASTSESIGSTIQPTLSWESCNELDFEGHRYRFCSDDRSWASARARCLEAGMDLVAVEGAAENAFVAANLTGASWTGANDAEGEGTWKWSSADNPFWQGDENGAAVGGAFTNWSPGQPDDFFGQDCARIGGDGKWSDEFCSVSRDYVCEGEGIAQGQPPDTNCRGSVFRGVEIWLCDNDVTWQEARERCRRRPGLDLISIQDAATNEFVFERLQEASWLGGNDRASEGEWRWAEGASDDGALFWFGKADGEGAPGAYANWHAFQPDDFSNEDCQEMSPLLGGKWSDQTCWSKRGFVCQSSADRCPGDAEKSAPGICGCGIPDADTDGDGTMDCVDECPNDPLRITPGICGCVGNPSPAPAGTSCSDGLCPGSATCDGAGSCGSAAACAPQSSCELRTFRRKAYWFCPGLSSWQTARQKCGGVPRTALVSIENQYENAFLYENLTKTSWIGGNDVGAEGTWRWAGANGADGATFWNGNESGASPRGVYSNWEVLEPDWLADCATMDAGDKGAWESRLCGEWKGYVCETCVPTTCAAEGAECGIIEDGCGGTLDCDAELGGCSGEQVCFTAAHRCSEPDGKACEEAIEPDFSLPVHERQLELNRAYAACKRPEMDECLVDLLARIRTDRQNAASLCFAGAIEPSFHNTIDFDRTQKKERARIDPTYACRLRDGDADHDLVPDDIDECPETLPLTPTDEVGCDTEVLLPGPDRDVMDLATGVISRFADPACASMGVPSTPIPDTLVDEPIPGSPGQRRKGIIMGAVHHPPGCEMFYEVRLDARLADGTERSYHLAWAEEEATSAGFGGRNGLLAVLFPARLTDDGDRGDWARAEIVSGVYSLRARNSSGVASPWSRFVRMGHEPTVGAWGQP